MASVYLSFINENLKLFYGELTVYVLLVRISHLEKNAIEIIQYKSKIQLS